MEEKRAILQELKLFINNFPEYSISEIFYSANRLSDKKDKKQIDDKEFLRLIRKAQIVEKEQ